jgi:hypothetical protein
MSDDLLDRLSKLNPVDDETVGRVARELHHLPPQLMERDVHPALRHRLTRPAIVAAVAAVVVLAVAIPLSRLLPLGGGTVPTPGPGNSAPGPSESPTPAPPAAIEVTTPSGGDLVRSPVLVQGSADVFEAVVSIRVLDADGSVIAHTTTMATCGTGCRGTYSVRVPYEISHRQHGTIVVFEASAKDGSVTNAVRIPVILGLEDYSAPAIEVDRPVSGDVVASPVLVEGVADVFEAVVSIRILDADGSVIADTTAMATCGTGCRGIYSTRVPYHVEHRQQGTILVFEVSAMDGSAINVVRIPVTLRPS